MRDYPTGLYGWIQSNDGRSTALFLGFMVAVQAISALVLFLPLAVVDPRHAPFLGTGGYFLRYAPLVFVASIAWFGWQLFWHIEAVKRAVGFHFVDDMDEPHLCRVIEPLIVTMGLPIPFVGVIEDSARNAFACGIARKKAVVVVTRGLIDDLDDAELSCVLAHELSHIKNGDIRLMAAANIFMAALTRLHRNNPLKFTPIHIVLSVAVPAVLPITLAGGFIAHLAMRAGQVSRLMISSAREFIADAEAVQLTRNPAAMASALVKVENRYRVENARGEDDAMMIAGETEGENATHPTVAQRIAALARTTGSMVFNAPGALPEQAWSASKTLSEARSAALLRQLPAARILPRVRIGSNENIFGLTRAGLAMLLTTVAALIGIHWSELGNPRAMAAKFDVRPIALLLGSSLTCDPDPLANATNLCVERNDADAYRAFEAQKNTLAGWLADGIRVRRERGDANPASLAGLSRGFKRVAYTGQSGKLEGAYQDVDSSGMYASSPGTFTNVRPPSLDIAEINGVGCFPAKLNYGDPNGHIGLGEDVYPGMNAYRFARDAEAKSLPTAELAGADEIAWFMSYIETRRTSVQIAYDNYGLPGLRLLQDAYASGGNAAIMQRLGERLAHPDFVKALSAYDAASAKAVARSPERYVPCAALKNSEFG